jgi:HlyD family secretion protein
MHYHRSLMARRWLLRIGIVLALVAVIVALRLTVFRPEPVPVTVFIAARGRVEETVTNSKAGTVRTRHRARISPEIGGRVLEVLAKKGARVTAGQILARLDDTSYRTQVVNAERAHTAAREGQKQACIEADLAQRDLVRAEGLAREKIVSEELLDTARSRRDASAAACVTGRARADQLDAQIATARAELAKTVVRAPFDGIVADVSLERGEWITPSPPGIPMPAVLDILDPDAIYVSAPLDEVDRGKVALDLPVRITMDAYGGKAFSGKVLRIAPYIEDIAEQSRTFETEAAFDDAAFARTLPPGASADIEVILRGKADALRIPAYALLEGRRVLLLVDDCPPGAGIAGLLSRVLPSGAGGCLVSRDVKVGLKNWEFAEIEDGLREGERVVVSLDRAEVKEGARARQTAVTEK